MSVWRPTAIRGRLSHPLVPVAGTAALSLAALAVALRADARGFAALALSWVVVGMAAGYSISGSV